MKRVQIPGTDLSVSALCYRLGSFGTPVRGEEADRLYAAYRDAGGSFFDSAHCYSFWVEGGPGAGERAQELASRLGCTPGRVALAYLMCHSSPVIPILGTLKVAHPEEDLAAHQVRLTPEEARWLREGE